MGAETGGRGGKTGRQGRDRGAGDGAGALRQTSGRGRGAKTGRQGRPSQLGLEGVGGWGWLADRHPD